MQEHFPWLLTNEVIIELWNSAFSSPGKMTGILVQVDLFFFVCFMSSVETSNVKMESYRNAVSRKGIIKVPVMDACSLFLKNLKAPTW